MSTSKRFAAIQEGISETFGDTPMSRSLAMELNTKWDAIMEDGARYKDNERALGNRIWMWYSGGDTCYGAARRILKALDIPLKPK